jgi:phosphoglycolate phosphatase
MPAFVACHGFAASASGLEAPSVKAVSRVIGIPLTGAFRRLYGERDDAFVDAYLALYHARADEVMTGLTVMLPGAVETLRDLHAAGIRLAIVSTKLRYRIEDVLGEKNLLDLFDTVIGGDDVPAYKPDPHGLLLALDRLGVAAEAAVYVGDTIVDAQTAVRANVPFVGVLTGATTREELMPYPAVALLDSVAEMPALLRLDETVAALEVAGEAAL